jgi:pimeloyl-ACP methyl ester carboxylesterase
MPPATNPENPTQYAEVTRREWRFDVSKTFPNASRLEVAATFVAPTGLPTRALLVCLPGGFLSRGYFDLCVAGDRGYSFAEAMAGSGFASLALDHLGIGESSKPDDGWMLDADALARANQYALEAALERLQRDGTPKVPVIGVGHSMGSCMAVVQQANHAPFSGLVLFSFSTLGLRSFLQGREAEVANDDDAIRARIVELAKERFASAHPGDERDATHPAFGVGTAPSETARALDDVATGILPIPALRSMIPGGYASWAKQVRIPTLVAYGDHDLPGSERGANESLPNATLDTVMLEDCWHCHFVANTRDTLFTHVASWVDTALHPHA